MTNQTVATAESLETAAEEHRERRGTKIPPYPGADARHFNVFWLGTKDKYNEVEVIFLHNPIIVLCYRTAVDARKNKGRVWPDEALHLSARYRLKNQDGLLIKQTKEGVTDLYADCFGDVAEKWTIIPALVRRPKYDERGKRLKFTKGKKAGKPYYAEEFRFIELGPGSDALRVIADTMTHPFFAKGGQGLLGSHWIVHKKGKNPPREGHWELKSKKTETGTEYIQHNEQNLLNYVIAKANREIPEEDYKKGDRKLYVSSFDEAYPIATPDQQMMTLQLHSEILSEHPDFEKRFPAMTKRINSEGELVGVTLDDDDEDDELDDDSSEEVESLEELEGDDDEVSFDDDDDDEGEELDDSDEEDDSDDEDEDDDSDDDDESEDDESDEDDESEDDESDDDDESEDDDDEEEESTDATSSDPQEDAGIADEDGDTSAFDFTNEAEEEVAKAKEKQSGKKKKKKTTKDAATKKKTKKEDKKSTSVKKKKKKKKKKAKK